MAKNYAVETVSALPFGMLIGAPLTAAIDAQTQAAKATIDFILQVGFLPTSALPPPGAANPQLNPDPDPVDVTQPDTVPATTENPATDAGRTRMVTFTYTTTNEDQAVVAAATAVAAEAFRAQTAGNAANFQNIPGATQAMIQAATAAAALP